MHTIIRVPASISQCMNTQYCVAAVKRAACMLCRTNLNVMLQIPLPNLLDHLSVRACTCAKIHLQLISPALHITTDLPIGINSFHAQSTHKIIISIFY